MEASSDKEALVSSEIRSKALMRGMMEHPLAAWLSRARTRHLETSSVRYFTKIEFTVRYTSQITSITFFCHTYFH